MNKDDVGRIAFVGILGVIGAVAITKPELNGEAGMNEGIIRWLIYTLACGLIINTQQSKPLKVIVIAALVSSLTLISVISFKGFMGEAILLSGTEISFKKNQDFAIQLLAGLFLLSSLAITMASYSRVIILSLLDDLFKVELTKAEQIEAILNKVMSIGAICAVIIFSIL